jgi:hypothetical protein
MLSVGLVTTTSGSDLVAHRMLSRGLVTLYLIFKFDVSLEEPTSKNSYWRKLKYKVKSATYKTQSAKFKVQKLKPQSTAFLNAFLYYSPFTIYY